MATHRLEASRDTVTQVFSRELPPVLTVEAGDTVVVHSLSGRGYLQRPPHPGAPVPQLFSPRRGHCLVGPIAVRGAKPGMALAVEIVDLRPDEWGYTEAMALDTSLNRRLGVAGTTPAWLLWSIDADAGTATSDRGFTLPTAPFLGILGLPPDEPGEHRTKPPRGCGGNVDCRELITGSTVFLPITVPDALLCIGDGHAAQGDGEVCGTAVECGMTSELRLDVVANPPIGTMYALTPTNRVTFGFSPDLEEATAQALEAMCDWMKVLFGLDRNDALALASCAVDLRITQVVNETWGVHAVLPRRVGPHSATTSHNAATKK